MNPSDLSPKSATEASGRRGFSVHWGMLCSVVVTALVLLWFYAFVPRYGVSSAFGWLDSAWNDETDYEHGPIYPLIILGLLIYKFREIRALASEPSIWGLAAIGIGLLFYLIGFRTMQPRITLGALPFLMWGSAFYLWGWPAAKILFFPLFFFWLAIPLPSFQQATVHLQLLATYISEIGVSLFGVETVVQGTAISSANGEWAPVEIAKGCSGIRSLMALMMITTTWSYLAKVSMWKKVLLFLSALPFAILGNALRVISILVIAEYGDEKWALGTWHDWSGLLLFYPITMMLVIGLHSCLERGLPWRNRKKVVVRRIVGQNLQPNKEP